MSDVAKAPRPNRLAFWYRSYAEQTESVTLGLGGLMLWIMLAVLGPVYDAVSSIKM